MYLAQWQAYSRLSVKKCKMLLIGFASSPSHIHLFSFLALSVVSERKTTLKSRKQTRVCGTGRLRATFRHGGIQGLKWYGQDLTSFHLVPYFPVCRLPAIILSVSGPLAKRRHLSSNSLAKFSVHLIGSEWVTVGQGALCGWSCG